MNFFSTVTTEMKFNMLAEELLEIKEHIKKSTEMSERITKELQAIANNESYITDKYIYTCETRRGSIDYSLIDLLRHINLEEYRRSDIKVWKLLPR